MNLENVKALAEKLLDTCSAARSSSRRALLSRTEPIAPIADKQTPAKSIVDAKVMIVDDDKSAQRVLQRLLENVAQCSVFANADEAYVAVHEIKPDLILLDDKMPGTLSGYELLQRIKSESELSGVEVIMITAVDEPASVLRCLAAGAADYIVKPYDPSSIEHKLRMRLARVNQKVLLVDDDKSTRDLLLNKFKSKGYPCIFARDGVEALEIIKGDPPSLVVLDRMMPGLDGLALLQMIRQIPNLRTLPVVMLSAKRSDNDIQTGLEQGASDYVVKPFNIDELVLRCEKLLDEHSERATSERANVNADRHTSAKPN